MNKTKQKRIELMRFLKSPDCPTIPDTVNPLTFGKVCLENFRDQRINIESQQVYDDIYGPAPTQISKNYDIGTW